VTFLYCTISAEDVVRMHRYENLELCLNPKRNIYIYIYIYKPYNGDVWENGGLDQPFLTSALGRGE
jgi:hypothetical protein